MLVLGSLIERKNHKELFEIFHKFHQYSNDYLLIIGSDGPLKNELVKLSNLLGINSLFTGYLNSVQKNYLISSSDIFVSTSLQEGFGLSAAEAMAWQKPVICYSAGGLVEVVDDAKTGFLIPPGNQELFLEKLILLSENTELRNSLGLAARKKIESVFSWPIIVQQTLDSFQNLIDP